MRAARLRADFEIGSSASPQPLWLGERGKGRGVNPPRRTTFGTAGRETGFAAIWREKKGEGEEGVLLVPGAR